MKIRRGSLESATRIGLGVGLVSLAACVTPPTTTFRDTYQTTQTGGIKSESHTSLLEVGLEDQIGAGFEYRLEDRFVRTDRSFDNGGTRTDELRTLNQPSLDLSLAFGALTWIQGIESFFTKTNPSGTPDNTIQRTNILEKMEWTPLDLPRVTAWLDRRTDEDDFFTDREDNEFVLQVEETRGPVNYFYSLEAEDIRDRRSDVRNGRLEHNLRGAYRDDYFDGKLSGRADFQMELRTATSRVPAAAASELEVILQAGLGAVDTTPEIAILPEIPALIDDDRTTPTGINIGGFTSGGETNWNIGARLVAGSTASVVYLYTSEEVDAFLLSQFSFSVWTSEDNNFWTPVTGSAAFTYDQVLRRFRIVFPRTQGRYLKVVNSASPPAAPAVLVTEIEIWGPGTGGGGGRKKIEDVSTITSLNSGLSYRPTEKLSLTYDVFLQTADRTAAGIVTRDETRIDNAMSLLWVPHRVVDVNVRATLQDIRDNVAPSQTLGLWSGLVDVRPLETLDIALSYTGTKRTESGTTAFETSGTQVRTSAQLLDTLSSDLTVERNIQRDRQNQRDIERFTVSTSMIASLTRSVDVTVGYRNESATVTGIGAGGIPDPSERQTDLLVLYQPSEQLTGEVRLEWKRSFVGSGLDRRFRIDWIPFRDGAIDLQLDMDHTEAGVLSTSAFDRYLMIGRWSMNPKAYFELDFAAQIPDQGPQSQTATVSFNLTL